jgi:glycosyltransferase involved in cell wall biosynthesis
MDCRLLYLVGQLGLGGLERQLYYLLQTMDRERYRPMVAVWNYCETDAYVHRIQALGVPLHYFLNRPSRARKLRAFRRLVRELKAEVVHSYSFHTNFAAWWATLGTKTIAIGAVRSDFIQEMKDAGPILGRLSARWPRSQIFNNFVAAKNARGSQSLFVPGQLFVVRNGLDLQLFRMLPLSIVGRACIVGIGSLLPVKRWDRLLESVLVLKQSGFDCLVQIAGDGPLRGSLEQQVQELGLTGYVEFLGHVADVPGLLSKATLLVHPSDTEGCPNVVIEAMACGRAVVATDVGDVPHLVDDGKTGYVVSHGHDAMLVEAIAKLITDRDLCRRMGEAGRAKAEKEFGLDRLVSETLTAYRAAGWKDA